MKLSAIIIVLIAVTGAVLYTRSLSKDPRITLGDQVVTITTDVVTAQGTYPTTPNMVVRATLKNFVEKTLTEFAETFSGLTEEDRAIILPEEGQPGYSMMITYEPFSTDSYYSILFTVTEYTGGAHHNSYFKTFVFTTAGVLQESLNQETIEKIAPYVKNQLEIQLGSIWEDGVAPRSENYRHYVHTTEGIRLYFDPYQVGPWSIGAPHVDVPFSVLY